MTPAHPHAFTLDLLALAVDRLPSSFSGQKKSAYRAKLDSFRKDPDAPFEDLQNTLVELGKESWPHRRAYEEMFERYGRSSEEAHLLERLDRGIREKYERFIHEGGKIDHIRAARSAEDLRRPSPFERFFTPEEKFAIGQALLGARDDARKEVAALVAGVKKDEYASLIESYKKKQKRIAGRIDELKALAGVSAKWKASIEDDTRTLEEGWSVVGRRLEEDEVDRTLDYWKGTLEAFLHA